MSDISILCVTRALPYALQFLDDMAELAHDLDAPLVLAADGDAAWRALDGHDNVIMLRSHGYIESVLDEAVGACDTNWILRLDDDERVSFGMYEWLLERSYRAADHWAFPRANLWPDEHQRLAGISDGFPEGGTCWPDYQTRLSIKRKSGGRTEIHQGSPFGRGRVAPVALEHHKLIVRGFDERLGQVRAYDRISDGAGSSPMYGPLQMPESWHMPSVPYVEMVPA